MREKWRRTYPSGASRTTFEAVPGPAQFQVRARGAVSHFTHGGLRIDANCGTDGPWVDCGLRFGHLA
eukprot:14255273-Alexandrium_andersonii.AAC.1